jgi:hypothetical protein
VRILPAFGRVGQEEENRMIPCAIELRGVESRLHFPHMDSTERVIFVKALRFAPTAGAAPTSGGLDKVPFYAPVFASSYGKDEEKNWEGAQATAKPLFSHASTASQQSHMLRRITVAKVSAAPPAHLGVRRRNNARKHWILLDRDVFVVIQLLSQGSTRETFKHSETPRPRTPQIAEGRSQRPHCPDSLYG